LAAAVFKLPLCKAQQGRVASLPGMKETASKPPV